MFPNTLRIAAATIAVLLLNTAAEARRYSPQVTQFCGERVCSLAATQQVKPQRTAARRHVRHRTAKVRAVKTPPLPMSRPVDPNGNPAVLITSASRPVALASLPSDRSIGALVAKNREDAPRGGTARNPNAGAIRCSGRGGSTATAGLHPVLQAKVREIVAACKTHVVSTYCRGGMTPNHRLGLAADLKGDPACIKRHMAGWPGGMSTDYYSAPGTQHYHISYSRAHEWGVRFAHNGGSTRTMHAKRRGSRHQAAIVTPHYETYAEDRNSGRQMIQHAVIDDGSRRGRYKSMKHRKASLAKQRYAANAH